jgi:hypothetical protein
MSRASKFSVYLFASRPKSVRVVSAWLLITGPLKDHRLVRERVRIECRVVAFPWPVAGRGRLAAWVRPGGRAARRTPRR